MATRKKKLDAESLAPEGDWTFIETFEDIDGIEQSPEAMEEIPLADVSVDDTESVEVSSEIAEEILPLEDESEGEEKVQRRPRVVPRRSPRRTLRFTTKS